MSQATRSQSRRLNALVRHRGADDPVTQDAARDLRVLTLAEHISEVVTSAPAPTPEQLTRLRCLLPDPGQ